MTDDIFFKSRITKLSRPIQDDEGPVRYEHNERLAVGEHVKMADGGQEGTVAEGGLIDLISRRPMVRILVKGEPILLAESAVCRV